MVPYHSPRRGTDGLPKRTVIGRYVGRPAGPRCSKGPKPQAAPLAFEFSCYGHFMRLPLLLLLTVPNEMTIARPEISSITPYRIPVDGKTEVIVAGSGFTGGGGTAAATCRLSAYRYIEPWYAAGALSCFARPGLVNPPGVSFDKPSPTNYTTPARILNATHLSCTPPPVVVEGVAVLAVSMDNITFSLPNAASNPTGPTCSEYLRPLQGCANCPLLQTHVPSS